jgi:hypothetical protein
MNSKRTQINTEEIRKKMQDIKKEFNKDIEILKKSG